MGEVGAVAQQDRPALLGRQFADLRPQPAVGQIGVVVCDLGLPGLSGLDVVRALRSRPETSTLPFLLMTGSGDGDTVLELSLIHI